ncbi:MAG: ATP-binding cassette domain-containing protein [Lachnospiraceae bacterium]|nr:ATP-binding cassette domain-containing protein [Lachnospiraceae bacterium]
METVKDVFVSTRNLTKIFDGEVPAVNGVDLNVKKGSLTALLGPSGCGKTTVLRMLAGLERPDAGDIFMEGVRINDVPARDRGIGFLFQNYALFPNMTVSDNIAFGLKVKKMPSGRVKSRVAELIDLIGLNGYENRFPYELSGGQKQRVAFARSLAPHPKLLLLDEPFAAIDAKIRSELRSWLREMIYQIGITGIFVTHDQEEAVEVSDEVILMNEGRISQAGTPDQLYRDPANEFAATFVGRSMQLEDCSILKGFQGIHGPAIIRPEYLEAFKADNPYLKNALPFSEDAVISDVRFYGNRYELELQVLGRKFIVQRSLERRPIHVGEKMHMLVYRLLLVRDGKVEMIENEALRDHDKLYSLYHW